MQAWKRRAKSRRARHRRRTQRKAQWWRCELARLKSIAARRRAGEAKHAALEALGIDMRCRLLGRVV